MHGMSSDLRKAARLYDTRSPQQHIVLDLRSLILGFASLHNQQMYPKMCSIDNFVNLQSVDLNLKGGLFDPRFGGYGRREWSGNGPFDSSPMGSY